ncbi:hypothetical protein [Methanosarcina sp.]|uniref:hypothetical protein n=1 Tax=Methanosarcina sp. TaxID=2213 RepID=UPI002617E367|nr:hypothetical protein [Methanosarcina sp.]
MPEKGVDSILFIKFKGRSLSFFELGRAWYPSYETGTPAMSKDQNRKIRPLLEVQLIKKSGVHFFNL